MRKLGLDNGRLRRLTNTTTACVTPNAAPFFCQAADEYLFWDGIHPTRAAHAILAHEASRVLARK